MPNHLTTVLAAALLAVLSGTTQAESVGVNFVGSNAEASTLDASATAGASGVTQAHWNNLVVSSGDANGRTNRGELGQVINAQGQTVEGMTVHVAAEEGAKLWRTGGSSWGFAGDNLTMQRGRLQFGPAITITDIPFERYHVYVYISAGDSGGIGSASISSAAGMKGEVSKSDTFFVNYRWADGRFVRSTARTQQDAKQGSPSNMIVFEGNTASGCVVRFNGRVEKGWLGVSAIQVVEAD